MITEQILQNIWKYLYYVKFRVSVIERKKRRMTDVDETMDI